MKIVQYFLGHVVYDIDLTSRQATSRAQYTAGESWNNFRQIISMALYLYRYHDLWLELSLLYVQVVLSIFIYIDFLNKWTTLLGYIVNINIYYVSKKYCLSKKHGYQEIISRWLPILCSKLIYKMGIFFLEGGLRGTLKKELFSF